MSIIISSSKKALQNYVRHKYLLLLLLPGIVYFIIFKYIPMGGILIAFKDYYPLKGFGGSQWVGAKHFISLFDSLYFWPVLRNTLIISFYKLIFGFTAPILLCLILNEVRISWVKRSVQTITYLPYFISWVVLGGIIMNVLSPSHGIINYFIKLLGGEGIFFMGEEKYFRSIVVLSSIWRNCGYQTIVYMAAITAIDPTLYEAGAIDGVGRLGKIWHITIPCISPTIIIMFIFAIGRIMNDDFDQIYNLLNARVMDVGDVIGTYTYRIGLQKMNYSYATAVGLFKNVVALILVTLSNRLSRKISGSSLW